MKNTPKNTLETVEWDPEEGEILIGVVHAKDMANTKFGTRPVVELRGEDGTLYTVWCNSVLTSELRSVGGIERGEAIAIRFDGTEDVGKGNAAKLYTVVKEEGEGSEEVERVNGAAEPAGQSESGPSGGESSSSASTPF